MCDNIKRDAQEIKMRLLFLGHKNIEESAIYDLLKSFGSHYELNSITDMIVGSSDPNDSGFYNIEAGPSNMKHMNETITSEDTSDMDVQENSMKEDNLYPDTSDSDDDNNGYYSNIGDESLSNDFTPQPSPPLITTIEFCTENFSPGPGTVVDLEILEENNNDPNNNLDAIQILQQHDQVEQIVDDNPRPGCSKDYDNLEASNEDKLQDEAHQICNLLPKFRYNYVYETLKKNRNAKNRIEVSLWDILPYKRPKTQYPPKRKHIEDKCIVDCEKVSPESLINDDVEIISFSTNAVKKREKSCKSQEHFLNGNRSSVNYNLVNMESGEQLQGSSQNDQNGGIIQNRILHPAKLVVKGPQNHGPSSANLILTPPKLNFSFPKNQTGLTCNTKQIQKEGQKKKRNSNPNISENKSKFGTLPSNLETNDSDNSSFKSNVLVDYFLHQEDRQFSKKSKMTLKPSNFNQQQTKKSVIAKPTLNSGFFSDDDICEEIANTPGISKDVPIVMNGAKKKSKSSWNTEKNYSSRSSLNEASLSVITSPPLFDESIATQKIISVGPKSSKEGIRNLETFSKKPAVAFNTAPQASRHKLVGCNSKGAIPKIYKKLVTSATTADAVAIPSATNLKKLPSAVTKEEEGLHPEMTAIYFKLKTIFPNTDSNYIKDLCQAHFNKNKLIDPTQRLQELIDILLQYGKTLVPIEALIKIWQEEEDIANERYNYLSGIFPDADPMHLRDVIKKVKNDSEAFEDYIQSQLEKPMYPTKEQTIAKVKITEQQKEYTTKFDVVKFLKIFPDPFAHFEDPNRINKFSPEALEFLKFHFHYMKGLTLHNVYSKQKYHLSLTVKILETMPADMKTKRIMSLIPTENIPLLQECAFITHKKEIKEYLDDLKAIEEAEFRQLKERNALLECQCCFDAECMPSKCSACDDGHVFCNTCIVKGAETRLGQDETRVPCFTSCKGEFHLSVLQKLLSPTQFSILLQKRQAAEVMAAGVEGLVSCPFCHFASIPPPEDKIFKCLNPGCMKESCRQCKELNHVPLKCYNKQIDSARLFLEEKMTEALVRKCYKCFKPYLKLGGCNKITCRCGAIMCYLCDKEITGYKHFDDRSGVNDSYCPLWTDDARIDAKTVLKVAQETVLHIQKKEPHLTINTSGLLPDVPNTIDDQYVNVPNADKLPERVKRLTKFE